MTSSIVLKVLQGSHKLALKSAHLNSISKSLLHYRPITVVYRGISTSKKDKDTATLADTLPEQAKTGSLTEVDAKPKNWISWGFDQKDIVDDNTYMHLSFFLIVTVCFVGITFILMYQPDNRMIDWVRREAFLELRYREENGLPLIDRNLIPPEKIELPTDEELGDIKIIV